MRRLTVAAVVAVVALTGCSGSSKKASSVSTASPAVTATPTGSSEPGAVAPLCAKLAGTQGQMATALQSLDTPSKVPGALNSVADDMQTLDESAPDDLKPTIDTLVKLFRTAAEAEADPANPNMAALQQFAAQAGTAVTNFSNYIKAHCNVGTQ